MPKINPLIKLTTLGSITFGLALVGLWLDQRFHTLPTLTIVGIFLGMFYSFYEAWRTYK